MVAKDVQRLPRKPPVTFLPDLPGGIPDKVVSDWEKMP
jgi:hypothetical protein